MQSILLLSWNCCLTGDDQTLYCISPPLSTIHLKATLDELVSPSTAELTNSQVYLSPPISTVHLIFLRGDSTAASFCSW